MGRRDAEISVYVGNSDWSAVLLRIWVVEVPLATRLVRLVLETELVDALGKIALVALLSLRVEKPELGVFVALAPIGSVALVLGL